MTVVDNVVRCEPASEVEPRPSSSSPRPARTRAPAWGEVAGRPVGRRGSARRRAVRKKLHRHSTRVVSLQPAVILLPPYENIPEHGERLDPFVVNGIDRKTTTNPGSPQPTTGRAVTARRARERTVSSTTVLPEPRRFLLPPVPEIRDNQITVQLEKPARHRGRGRHRTTLTTSTTTHNINTSESYPIANNSYAENPFVKLEKEYNDIQKVLGFDNSKDNSSSGNSAIPFNNPGNNDTSSEIIIKPIQIDAKSVDFSASPAPFTIKPHEYSPISSEYNSNLPEYSSTPSGYHKGGTFNFSPSPKEFIPRPFENRENSNENHAKPFAYNPTPNAFDPRPFQFSVTTNDYNPKPTDHSTTPSVSSSKPFAYGVTPSEFLGKSLEYSAVPNNYNRKLIEHSSNPNELGSQSEEYGLNRKDNKDRTVVFNTTPKEINSKSFDFSTNSGEFNIRSSQFVVSPSEGNSNFVGFGATPSEGNSNSVEFGPTPIVHHATNAEIGITHREYSDTSGQYSVAPEQSTATYNDFHVSPNRQNAPEGSTIPTDIAVPPLFQPPPYNNTIVQYPERWNASFFEERSLRNDYNRPKNTFNIVNNSLLAPEVASLGMKIVTSKRGMEMLKEFTALNNATQYTEKPVHHSRVANLETAETGDFRLQAYNNQILAFEDAEEVPKEALKVLKKSRKPFRICSGREGYVSDSSSGCQVFYICSGRGAGEPMMCPNGTLFNQDFLVCDWWYNVECNG